MQMVGRQAGVRWRRGYLDKSFYHDYRLHNSVRNWKRRHVRVAIRTVKRRVAKCSQSHDGLKGAKH